MKGDGTHNKKPHHITEYITARGLTPIEKNIIVVDEHGNEYEATYPKRAKGLVKNGRARFIDKNKICLACPPNNNLEEYKMSESKKKEIEENTINNDVKLTREYIFTKIEELTAKLTSLKSEYEALISVNDSLDESWQDFNDDVIKSYAEVSLEKVNAVSQIFVARETTIQKLLAFYINAYANAK